MPSKNRKTSPRVRPAIALPAPKPRTISDPRPYPETDTTIGMSRYVGRQITREAIVLYNNACERVANYKQQLATMDKSIPGLEENCIEFLHALEQEKSGAVSTLIDCIIRWSDKPKNHYQPCGVSVDGWVYVISYDSPDADRRMTLFSVARLNIINLDDPI